MKIEALDIYYVKNPLLKPWTTAYGSDNDIYTVLVKMTSDGCEAWSEACPLFSPTYSPEYAFGVYHVVSNFLAPLVLGKCIHSAKEMNSILKTVKGNPFAKAAIEEVWWTMQSKQAGRPLHELLGGTYHEVEVGADFGVQDSIDTLLHLIDGAIQAGYPRVKLKAMPGWDLEMLQAVRSAFPRNEFHIDCNSGYTLEDKKLFEEIDKFALAMIEQPLFHTDIIDHAKLQQRLHTPICLDESITSTFAARQALEIGACKYINIKPGRVGGLYPAICINDLCKDAGVGCWIGGMLESGVGAGICVELATLPNMTYPSDLFPSNTFYATDLTDEEVVLSSPGRMLPSKIPGNAYLPDPERLLARTILHEHLE